MIGTEELAGLVPHQGKMFLLSRIVSWDFHGHSLSAEFDVHRDCLFYKEELDGLPSWVGFELMAQSISALSGLRGRKNGQGPRYGFILSVSGLVLHGPALRGTVSIKVKEEAVISAGSGADQVYSFLGRVLCGTEPAAEAKLTVMDVDDLSIMNRQTEY